MIDSHCHLYFKTIKNNFEDIIQRAKKNNIKAILSINTTPEDFENHLNLIRKYKSLFLCIMHIKRVLFKFGATGQVPAGGFFPSN